MTVFVNDKPQDLPRDATLSVLAETLHLPSSGVALALNNQVIRREQWSETVLTDQDKIIIIKAVCGG